MAHRRPLHVLDPRDRAIATGGVAIILAGLAYLFLTALAPALPHLLSHPLEVFTVAPPAPPPPPETPPPPASHHRPQGAAAPPNIRSHATPIVLPTPEVRLVVPPLVVAAPIPNLGAQASQGAAPVAGPGSGAGGVGSGTGSGGRGTGDGDGDGEPLRQLNDIRWKDLPAAVRASGAHGVVGIRFTVGTNGRLSDCHVTRTSGNAALDAATCQVMVAKLRYVPSRDRDGRPYADQVSGTQDWPLIEDRDGGDRDDS